MDPWFLTAAGLSFLAALIHLIAGGKEVARPLLSSVDMGTIPRLTAYYCWHVTTIVLLAITASFAWLTFHPQETGLAVLSVFLVSSFTLLSVALVVQQKLSPWALPQWTVFLAISIPASIGLLT